MPVQTYDEWRGGPTAARPDTDGNYNANNMQVYENGTIGPRPGWKARAITGATGEVHDGTADDLHGLTWYRQTDDGEGLLVWFYDAGAPGHKYDIVDLEEDDWDPGGSVGSITGSGESYHRPEYGDRPIIRCSFDGFNMSILGPYIAFNTASSPGTFTVPTSMPNGQPRNVTIYRERAYFWGFASAPGRVYYTAPSYYDAWDDGTEGGSTSWAGATSYFDVNADYTEFAGAVTGMWSIKNALIIARKDDTYMVLTGTSPANGTLRELGKDQVPDFGTACIVDNELYYLDRAAKGVRVATPAYIETKELEYMSPTAYAGSTSSRPDNNYFPLESIGDDITRAVFLPARAGNNAALITAAERVNDVWSLSTWNMQDYTAEDIRFSRGRPNEMWAVLRDTAETEYKVYSRYHTLNRPSNSGDTLSTALSVEDGPTSPTGGRVDLAPVEAGEGKIVRPVKVVLDIDYWKGGSYATPSVEVIGTITGCDNNTPTDTLATQTITTTGWDNSSGDLPYRRRVSVPLPQGQYGTSFYITIQNIESIALDTVQVYYQEQNDPR